MTNNFGVPIYIQNSANELMDTIFSSIPTQVNVEDEQQRMIKLKDLEFQSKQVQKKYATYIGLGALSIGILWYISK
jgi:hypothetical protein